MIPFLPNSPGRTALGLTALLLAAAAQPAYSQLVPMIGAAAIQGSAAVANPAPGLMQDARQTVGAYNQRTGLPLPGGPGAMPIQAVAPTATAPTATAPTATAQPSTADAVAGASPAAGYVVNGQVITQCSSGLACLHELRRAMGVAP